jgi:hypothetical protein
MSPVKMSPVKRRWRWVAGGATVLVAVVALLWVLMGPVAWRLGGRFEGVQGKDLADAVGSVLSDALDDDDDDDEDDVHRDDVLGRSSGGRMSTRATVRASPNGLVCTVTPSSSRCRRFRDRRVPERQQLIMFGADAAATCR